MRFKHLEIRQNKEGDIKVKTFFAIFPVRIGNETRWLEKVSVRYIYEEPSPWNLFGSWDKLDFECAEHFKYGTHHFLQP